MKKAMIVALVAVFGAAVVHAESVTQVAINLAGSDWSEPSIWSNGEAPSSGNTYSITNRLNSPNTPAMPQAFGGDSLLLEGPDANLQLRCRNEATDAVSANLILNGGKVALNQSSSSYGLIQGEMSVIGTTTLAGYQNETQVRSMRVDSLISGGTSLLLRSSSGYSQPGDSYIEIGNELNTFSGTWDIDNVRGIFTSAGATGTDSDFVVGSGGYLQIDESWTGIMSVTNGAQVEVKTNVTYYLSNLAANGSSVATGSYSVAELNAEIGSMIFSGAGAIVVDSNAAAYLPQFIADPIVKTNATYGTDYVSESQTLAGSATNAFGGTMTYEKVDGPAWLVVATNGALSGTPTVAGIDEFAIKAVTGVHSSLGTLQITVDSLGGNPPEFTTHPVVKADGVYNEDYAVQGQSLTNNATDADLDTLTFAKTAGAAWLNVASNGVLSGVADVLGTNMFTITVDDGNGNRDIAELLIYVAPPAPNAPDPDGLVAWWPMNEGTGTSTANEATNAYHGTINGGTTWVTNGTGNRATYLSFDGQIGSYVDPSLTLPLMTTSNAFTWAVWAKTANTDKTFSIIIGNRRDGSGTETDFTPREFIKVIPTSVQFRPNDVAESIDHADLVLDEWTHLAVVKSGTNVQTYVNGVPDSSGRVSGFQNALPFFIGGDNENKVIEFFEGGIDDVRLYDYALSAAEIAFITQPPVKLAVNSTYGTPSPGVGTNEYAYGDAVALSVDPLESENGTNYLCTGWTGTGSVPASGSGADTGSIVLTNALSSIVWNWEGPLFWLDVETVGSGTVSVVDGFYDAGSTQAVVATPDYGWSFTGWEGDAHGLSTNIEVVVVSNMVITATFSDDPDNDGLTNLEEEALGTNPADPDSDNDGLSDGYEVETNGVDNIYLTDPLDYDSDNDGTSDGYEIQLGFNPKDPNDDPDKDEDQMLDLWEVGYFSDIVLCDPGDDPDGDLYTNLEEHGNGTDPTNHAAFVELYPAFEVTWKAVGGTDYQVQVSTNLAEETWSDVGTPITGSGSRTGVLVRTRNVDSSMFRIEVLP